MQETVALWGMVRFPGAVMGKQQGRVTTFLLALLLVLAAGLLLLPFLYHQLQVGSDMQGYLWVFGARPLVLLLLFALVLIVVLAVIRRRR